MRIIATIPVEVTITIPDEHVPLFLDRPHTDPEWKA